MTTQASTQSIETPAKHDSAHTAGINNAANDANDIAAIDDAARGHVPPPEAAMDDAARAPASKPEAEASIPNTEAVMPPPHMELPKPSPAMPSPAAKGENLILLPAVLADAEKNLAAHIGTHIDPILEKNLMLNVSSNLENGTTNLVLSFEGDMVSANPAVLGEQVIAALHALPSMQSLIADHRHTPTAEFHDGALRIVVPHLTTANYAHLIQALASGVAAKTDSVPPAQSAATEMHSAAEVAAVAQANAAHAVGSSPATRVAHVTPEGVANNNELSSSKNVVGI